MKALKDIVMHIHELSNMFPVMLVQLYYYKSGTGNLSLAAIFQKIKQS